MYDNPYERNENLTPAEDMPAENKPAEDMPAEDIPAENKPAEEKSGESIFASQNTEPHYTQPSVEPPVIKTHSDYQVDEYYRENFSQPQAPAQDAPIYSEDYYSGESYAHFNSGYIPQNYAESPRQRREKREKVKKEPKPVTRGALAVVLMVSILSSMVLGVGGGYFAGKYLSSDSTKNTAASGAALSVNKSDSASSSYASSGATLTTAQIVEKSADAVVEITTESVVTGSFSQQYIQSGAGSGVIVTTDGYIVTNNHVIEGASHITVTLRDQTEYTDVEVVGTYEAGDIALLKIKPKGTLKAATLGDSDKIAVGDYAVVIGNPLGQLGGSVTDGIVSALDRAVTIDNQTMNLLQTNAEISPGNSGGGLFNGAGELIGIVNAKSSSESAEGIGFAIPINDVQDVLSDLKQYGYVKGQIDLGMSLADLNSTAQLWMFGANQTGVYVTSVNDGSNAYKAGFKGGDIITAVNGKEVKSTTELNAIINKLKVGDKATFKVYRSGRTGEISMTLEEYTADSDFANSQNNNNNNNNNNNDSDDGWSFDSPWDIFN